MYFPHSMGHYTGRTDKHVAWVGRQASFSCLLPPHVSCTCYCLTMPPCHLLISYVFCTHHCLLSYLLIASLPHHSQHMPPHTTYCLRHHLPAPLGESSSNASATDRPHACSIVSLYPSTLIALDASSTTYAHRQQFVTDNVTGWRLFAPDNVVRHSLIYVFTRCRRYHLRVFHLFYYRVYNNEHAVRRSTVSFVFI